MQEKYIFLECVSYVNKENKTINLACVYITNGKSCDILKISVDKDTKEFLQQYEYQDITHLIVVEYDIFNKRYVTKINI